MRPLRGFQHLADIDEATFNSMSDEERASLRRELTIRNKLSQQRTEEWFEDQVSRGSDEDWLTINFNSEVYAWVADQVQLSAPRIPQGPPVGGGPGFP